MQVSARLLILGERKMQIPSNLVQDNITISELLSHVPAGSASPPIAKLKYRLCATLRWWWDSIPRIIILETCSLPIRILNALKERHPAGGMTMLPDPLRYRPQSFPAMNNYTYACKRGMQLLHNRQGPVGYAEAQIYILAFQQGATWGVHNACSKKYK